MEHSNAAQTPAHRPHPNYLAIFGWLTLFTIVEVMLSFVPASLLPDVFRIGALITIAVIKATLVVLYYMHLRYDSKWYALILITGVAFALLAGRLLFAILK
jgi:cytochrome c oxidase subunit IV